MKYNLITVKLSSGISIPLLPNQSIELVQTKEGLKVKTIQPNQN